jgi:uncharacterized integral membrane protein (TIGR00697 family)
MSQLETQGLLEEPSKSYKYLLFFSLLYMVILLTTILFSYRIVNINHMIFSTATFIIPLWFCITDLITEVYGYRIAKRLILYGLYGEGLFVLIIFLQFYLIVPTALLPDYHLLLDKMPRIFLTSLISFTLGDFINIYCLSKWKLLLCGRFFFLRILSSTFIGMIFLTFIGFYCILWEVVPGVDIFKLVINAMLYKVIAEVFFAAIVSMIVPFIKKQEYARVDSLAVAFNPFLKTNDER